MSCNDDSCFKDGIEYKHGSIVPKADGCNDCICSNGKTEMCTKMPCPKSEVIAKVYFFMSCKCTLGLSATVFCFQNRVVMLGLE